MHLFVSSMKPGRGTESCLEHDANNRNNRRGPLIYYGCLQHVCGASPFAALAVNIVRAPLVSRGKSGAVQHSANMMTRLTRIEQFSRLFRIVHEPGCFASVTSTVWRPSSGVKSALYFISSTMLSRHTQRIGAAVRQNQSARAAFATAVDSKWAQAAEKVGVLLAAFDFRNK